MVSALIPRSSSRGSNPGRGHCVVFLGKTLNSHLGRIQDLMKGGSDKRLLKVAAPGGSGGMLPQKSFNFRAYEMRLPAFLRSV